MHTFSTQTHTSHLLYLPTPPPQLYINTIQIGYNIFLSFLGNKKVEEPEALKDAEKKVGDAVGSAVDKVKKAAK